MHDTIFHKIQRGEIPAQLVYEDAHLFAFRDIAPQAPVHVLFVPKRDYATLNDVPEDSREFARFSRESASYGRGAIHQHGVLNQAAARVGCSALSARITVRPAAIAPNAT